MLTVILAGLVLTAADADVTIDDAIECQAALRIQSNQSSEPADPDWDQAHAWWTQAVRRNANRSGYSPVDVIQGMRQSHDKFMLMREDDPVQLSDIATACAATATAQP